MIRTEDSELGLESMTAIERTAREGKNLSNSGGEISAAFLSQTSADCKEFIHNLYFWSDYGRQLGVLAGKVERRAHIQ
jgi:flagellar motor component MotA